MARRERAGGRSGGRGSVRESQRARAAGVAGIEQLPYAQLRNPFPPIEVASADQIEAIHQASMQVLQEIGMNFLLPEAREILAAAGADVRDGDPRVRFDPALVEELVARAPATFTLHARNPERNITYGENIVNFASVGSAPYCSSLDGGRRRGTHKDFRNLIRLVQSFNICHVAGGYPVEPTDLETPIRHLEAGFSTLELTDKAFYGYSLGRDRILDVIEMARISRQIDAATLTREPSIYTIVNANSPLQYDIPMLWGMIEMARRNQIVIVTPFTLSGAMAPVTIAGATVQQNAEALAGIAFLQAVQPGAPSMYGGFTSNVDMKTGSPAFGTPEYTQATLLGAQLARRYNVPFRASNTNASNAPDVQAAYESEMSIWACVMGHVHHVNHGLGWLEGGLTASFEKVVIDAEMLQMMARFLRPLEIDEASLALDAMREVGPGGHYFAAQHTLERYETAFYTPILSDWRNFETWAEDGARDATQRANGIVKAVLEAYEPPPMDPAVREELRDFVDRRTAEGGAPMQ